MSVSSISLHIAQMKHVVNWFLLIIVRFANLSVYATFLESKIVIRSSKVRKNGTSLIRLSASKWVNSVISSFMFNLTYFCSGKLMYITQLLGYIVVCYSKNIYHMFYFTRKRFFNDIVRTWNVWTQDHALRQVMMKKLWLSAWSCHHQT